MKRLTFILVALLCVLGIANPAFQNTGSVQARQDVTITQMASQDWIVDAEIELAKQFEEETGIHVDFQIIPADQYFNVLQTKLNTGEAADIFGGQSGQTDLRINYDVETNAIPLTDQEWVSRMEPLVTEQVSLDGEVYGMSLMDPFGPWAMVYNTEIFADLDLAIPTTYEEFKAVCQAIQDAGITPIFEPVSAGWHHVLWFPELGPRYEEVTPGLAEALNTNQSFFADDSTMLTALEQLKELYDLGFFGEYALSDTYEETAEYLASGEYAMTVGNFGLIGQIEAEYDVPADTFGYFVMPLADNQILNLNPAGPSKFVYSGSDHIDEALAYLDFLARPENLQYIIDNTPRFKGFSFTGLEYDYTATEQVFLDRYDKRGTVYQTRVKYLNPQWMEIGQDISAMFIGDAEPMDVLNNIDDRRSDMAEAANDPAWGG